MIYELSEFLIEICIHVVKQAISAFLLSHLHVRGLRILWELLVKILDVYATVNSRILIANVVQVCKWIRCRDGHPARLHLDCGVNLHAKSEALRGLIVDLSAR